MSYLPQQPLPREVTDKHLEGLLNRLVETCKYKSPIKRFKDWRWKPLADFHKEE